MEFAGERELVHLRYELRRLLADGRREDASPLLNRLRQLAADQAGEVGGHVGALGPEIHRWESTFDL